MPLNHTRLGSPLTKKSDSFGEPSSGGTVLFLRYGRRSTKARACVSAQPRGEHSCERERQASAAQAGAVDSSLVSRAAMRGNECRPMLRARKRCRGNAGAGLISAPDRWPDRRARPKSSDKRSAARSARHASMRRARPQGAGRTSGTGPRRASLGAAARARPHTVEHRHSTTRPRLVARLSRGPKLAGATHTFPVL